jgi:hypothetical protein
MRFWTELSPSAVLEDMQQIPPALNHLSVK